MTAVPLDSGEMWLPHPVLPFFRAVFGVKVIWAVQPDALWSKANARGSLSFPQWRYFSLSQTSCASMGNTSKQKS